MSVLYLEGILHFNALAIIYNFTYKRRKFFLNPQKTEKVEKRLKQNGVYVCNVMV